MSLIGMGLLGWGGCFGIVSGLEVRESGWSAGVSELKTTEGNAKATAAGRHGRNEVGESGPDV